MALQDLLSESKQTGFGIDEATEHQLVDQVLGLVNDANGEVKSQAVKTCVPSPPVPFVGEYCVLRRGAGSRRKTITRFDLFSHYGNSLATLVPHLAPARHATLIDRLVQFTSSKDEGVRDIASLGLKMVVAEVQPGSPLAGTCCSKLAPEVVKQLNEVRQELSLSPLTSSVSRSTTDASDLLAQSTSSAELILDSLDLLSDILSRFCSTLSSNTALQTSILRACTPLLSNGRAAVRKRTVSTLAILINTSSGSPALLNGFLEDTILPSLKGDDSEKLRTSISLVGALARTAPAQLSPKVGELVPLVLAGSAKNDEEGKEGVLQVRSPFFLSLVVRH